METLVTCCYRTLDAIQREQGLTMIELGQTQRQRDQLAETLAQTLYRSGLIQYSPQALHTLIDGARFTTVVQAYLQHRPSTQVIASLTTTLAKDYRCGSTVQSKRASSSSAAEEPTSDPLPSLSVYERARTGRTTHRRVGPRRDTRRTGRCDPYAMSET